MSEKIDWPYWSKLPEVKVFEAIALLHGTEPDSAPPEEASPEYRKTLRLLLASLSDRSIFTPGTLNMGDPALNGVKLAEVARWALANGLVLPDKFPQPVRISKAPPPITPLSGTSHITPASPPVPPPNWGKWAYMRDIEIWEAVALTLNLEPDQLPVYLGAYDKLGDDPFRICPTPFLERLLVANSNCGISLGFKPVHELKARCLVDLPEFAAWAVKLKIPNLPPELVALAAPTEQLAPAQSTATPAPVASASDAPAIRKNQRPDLLTPLIEKAQRDESDPFSAAVIWPKLCDMAERKTTPFVGKTESGLKWIDANDSFKYLTKDALGDRLRRLKNAR